MEIYPDWFQSIDDPDRWFECPDDAEIIWDSFYGKEPKVGDTYNVNVCWNGTQTFRITKVPDENDDNLEVEFVEGTTMHGIVCNE